MTVLGAHGICGPPFARKDFFDPLQTSVIVLGTGRGSETMNGWTDGRTDGRTADLRMDRCGIMWMNYQCVCVCLHTIYIYIHTHTYTYIYIYIWYVFLLNYRLT